MNTTTLQQQPRVSISMSRKINLGNYESTDIFVSLASDVEEGGAIIHSIMEKVQRMLDAKVAEITATLKEKK